MVHDDLRGASQSVKWQFETSCFCTGRCWHLQKYK